MKEPLIFEIKGGSLDDGPGLRTVVFFKGCPLSCIWCHNPEGMRKGFEHSFDVKECIKCLRCLDACSRNAVTYADSLKIDKSICIQCFSCASACPSGALEVIGKSIGKEKLVETILKDKPFFDTSGGGVTLSGGEPTLYMDFCSEMLKDLKENRVNTLLETCGCFDMAAFNNKMLPWLDAIYYDIKLFDAYKHRKFCGASNEVILNNFMALAISGVELLPRVPLVPGITDNKTNLGSLAMFLVSCGIKKVKLLAYNPLWPDKLDKFRMKRTLITEPMRQFMKPEHILECRAVFEASGIQTI